MTYVLESTKNQLSSATKPPRGLRAKANLLEDSDFGIVNKKEIKKMAEFIKKNTKRNNRTDYGSKSKNVVEAPDFCSGVIEYKMGREMAENIVRDNKSKANPQEALCAYVNTHFGLKGYCVKVIIDGE